MALPFTVIFEYPTLRELAAHLLLLLHSPSAAPIGAQADQGASLGDLADAADAAAAAAAELGAKVEAHGAELLLSPEAKALGVACSPAQMFFIAAHQVSECRGTTGLCGHVCMRACF